MTSDNDQILLRNSERKSYRRCRQQWKWKYLDRLTPISTKGALAFGTMIHTSLELWYPPGRERGIHPAETFARAFDEADREFGQWDDEGKRHDARELGIAMMQNYVDTFGTDPHLEVIAPEMPFEVDIFWKKGERYLITVVGRFDLVFLDHTDGEIWLDDHKTAKAIKTDHLELDDQAGTYLLCATPVLRDAGFLEKDQSIAGILYNFMRKAKPDDRPRNHHGQFLNKNGSVSKRQPPPYFLRQKVYRSEHDHRTQLTRLRKEAYEMNLVRDGDLPIYKNPTKDCSWDCDFFDMCIQHETGADWRETRDLMFETWDPYEDHVEEEYEETA